MDRATRDKFVSATDQKAMAYGESACLETPPLLFQALQQEFPFQIDLCANEQNHLLPRWFGPQSPVFEYDALQTDWSKYGTCGFANPVYGDFIDRILPKAVEEATKGFTSVWLLPLRVNSWFKEIVIPLTSWRIVDQRITFWYQGRPKPSAKIKATKREQQAFAAGVRHVVEGRKLIIDPAGYWVDSATGHYQLEPAGALFDSIVVVIEPQIGHMVWVPQAPTIWHWDKARVRRSRVREGMTV